MYYKQQKTRINKFSRHQQRLRVKDVYPQKRDNTCACGCGIKLTGRQTMWSSSLCRDKAYHNYLFILGDTQHIRFFVHERDGGVCCECGLISDEWHADHILAVKNGGGACNLDNFQTLCITCHKEKTQEDLTESHNSTMFSQELNKSFSLSL